MNETLRKLREQNNYSQNSISTFLGISRQIYIKYEQGIIEPPVKVIKNLAKFYKVPYDYIIDDKLATNTYSIANATTSNTDFAVSEPTPSYGAVQSASTNISTYMETILGMLPKLIYSEQLQLLAKLCDIVKTGTEEKKEPSKKMQAYQRLLALNEELHLKSDGKKWTREELYERH